MASPCLSVRFVHNFEKHSVFCSHKATYGFQGLWESKRALMQKKQNHKYSKFELKTERDGCQVHSFGSDIFTSKRARLWNTRSGLTNGNEVVSRALAGKNLYKVLLKQCTYHVLTNKKAKQNILEIATSGHALHEETKVGMRTHLSCLGACRHRHRRFSSPQQCPSVRRECECSQSSAEEERRQMRNNSYNAHQLIDDE